MLNMNGKKNTPKVKYYQTDYKRDQLVTILRSVKPNAIIHLAAKRLNKNDKHPGDYISNLETANNLFEAAFIQGITNIVYLSTIGVYGINPNLPWNEKSETPADNPYSLSKLWIEKSSVYYNQKGLNIKILRVAQCIGQGEREGFLLQTYLRKSINKEVLDVYGSNHGKRRYIYIKDLICAIEKAIVNRQVRGAFNIGMAQSYSFSDLAQTVNEVFENKAGIRIHPEKQADENIYAMSIEKAKNVLEWEPHYDLMKAYEDIKTEMQKTGSI